MISKNPFYLSGREKFEAQDFEGALKDYSQAIKQEEDPFLYSERGVVYFHLKDLKNSLGDMEYALNLEPENPYRYSSRAYIKDAMGDLVGAIKDYEEAVRLDPEDSIAYNNLGLLLEKQGYKEKAKRNFERADSLAGVDKLIDQIRKEEKEKSEAEKQQEIQSAPNEESKHEKELEERTNASAWALLRDTFTTKSGFNDYLSFIKNGLKSRS
jgi:tetratricopeptide (TPR) repeat protein